jgi:hypothetical protein
MTISNVTAAKFEDAKARLIANHATVAGDTIGVISGHGVTANFSFDERKRELTVDVVHHPFYMPVSAIESEIAKAFK